MSYNGSGTFQINTSGQPVVATTTIAASVFNAFTADVATGLSTAICKDGQTTITANIPFNDKKITGLAAGTARTDAASLATIQDGTGVYVATVGGTADVITLTPSPAITAYAAGQRFAFLASGANTTNVTVAVSGLASPKAITKNGTTALAANDITSGAMVEILYDGTQFMLLSVTRQFLPIVGGTLTGNLTMGAHLLFTDATYDIGASGATRPRDGFFSRNVVIGGTLGVTGVPTIPTAAADTNTTQAASTAFVLAQAASQAELETGSSTTKFVTAGRQQFHASAAKMWIKAEINGTIAASYNVTSISDDGTGAMTVTIATDFSGTEYAIAASVEGAGDQQIRINDSPAAGTISVQVVNNGSAAADPSQYHLVAFGDQ